jgi:aminotransferase in exopolysaccharide biosynthesis
MSDAPPYLPLSAPVLAGNEWSYVKRCLDTGWVSSAGEFVGLLEDSMVQVTGARHAVACQTGTAALHLALLLHGVGPGDAVVCPTLTFIATANAIAYTGARPVLVGCDAFMNLSPSAVRGYLEGECNVDDDGVPVDKSTGLCIKAILPVHVFGNPCDMSDLMAVADSYGLAVIEDAAEALGSRWSVGGLAGRHAGTVGSMGAFSFNGNKIVTSGGGGCLVTDDPDLAARARHLATTAKVDPVRFVHDEVGYNYRLTNMASALAVAQLEQLDGFVETKRANHARYAAALVGIPGLELLGTPAGTRPNHWFYSLLVEPGEAAVDREGLMAHLEACGIQTRPVWALLHRQPPYIADRTHDVEQAEWFWERVLNLPCSSNLSPEDVDRVCSEIRGACSGRRH